MSQIISLLHTPLPGVFHITRDKIEVLGMSCSVHHNLGVSTTDLPPASPLTLSPTALLLLSSVTRASLLDPEHAQHPACLFPPSLPAENSCCGSVLPCDQPSNAPNSRSIDSVHDQQAVQGLAGMAALGSTGSQLGAACLPPSGRWSVHSALLGPTGRLSASKAPLPSARPFLQREDTIPFHPAASVLPVGGVPSAAPSAGRPSMLINVSPTRQLQ